MPKKITYDVKLEVLVPTTITYRVSALNEQDAIKEIEKFSARTLSVKHQLPRKIKLKATVYTLGSNMVKLSKTYRNI